MQFESIEINCPSLSLTGDLSVDGIIQGVEISDNQGSLSRLRNNHNIHNHVVAGNTTTVLSAGQDV